MKLVFILQFLSTILAYNDGWGENNKSALITDLSNICTHHYMFSMFVPYGMGQADSIVILISDGDEYPNCRIIIRTDDINDEIYMMAVVEFPDHTIGPNNACQEKVNKIGIFWNERYSSEVCEKVNAMVIGKYETARYYEIRKESSLQFSIESKDLFETIKITVTAVRKLKQNGTCKKPYEIQCLIDNNTVCISSELLCDGNINCGMGNSDDEDQRICDVLRYKLLWLVVLCSLIMLLVFVFFFIHLLHICVPQVADTFFIFNENEDNKLILTTQFSLAKTYTEDYQKLDNNPLYKFKTIAVTENIREGEGLHKTGSNKDDIEVELKSELYHIATKIVKEQERAMNKQIFSKDDGDIVKVEDIYKSVNFNRNPRDSASSGSSYSNYKPPRKHKK